ncbi:glycoside hydrolase domain-containing protein [Nocardioides coralli]|uniref:glycoside hydrolase domain-containing protein n=1 Tax=Nocardioides coralli TaxID=2872154 RepID=UPI001CA45EC9|nr:glycoside hydrolase domain-containing protein [Nocardioides coralli]QZY28851.1 DUF1906 domain-containing protein [Nocardioides coralli]
MRSTALRRPLRRPLHSGLAALLVAGALLTSPTPAHAGNVVTPGHIRGYGFDQCVAPTQKAMNTWLKHSPFLAVGIYISGASRGCRDQPNLTPTWVSTQLRKGWRLLPITLGPQASCSPHFPRYGNDPTINPKPGKSGNYPAARKQGRREAGSAVTAAKKLGIVPGSTLWYDLEGFDASKRHCRESALAFLSGWTWRIRDLGYVSGVYSSASSGIKMLDDARVDRPGKFNLPDRIWIARWDGQANTHTDYIRKDGWRPGGRMKQYRGGHNETWGGVTINIDSNWLDLGKGSWTPPVKHCGGVDVDHRDYLVLDEGTTQREQVRTLQCLLDEQGVYDGRLTGRYNRKTVAAVGEWQADHGFAVSSRWTRRHWMSLLAAGGSPVLKFGSASDDVRRLQRALHAADRGLRLPINGRYTRRTAQAVTAWQKSVGHRANGILIAKNWRALRRGKL